MSNFLLALVGKSGAGKNVVAALLAKRGFTLIDVDGVGHQQLEQNTQAVRNLFPELGAQPGKIDRRELGRLVFSSATRLHQLEQILHPLIRRAVEEEVAQRTGPVAIQGAVLEKIGLLQSCQLVIWLDAPLLLRLWRLRRRDPQIGWTELLKRCYQQRYLRAPQHLPHWVRLCNGFGSNRRTLNTHLDRMLPID